MISNDINEYLEKISDINKVFKSIKNFESNIDNIVNELNDKSKYFQLDSYTFQIEFEKDEKDIVEFNLEHMNKKIKNMNDILKLNLVDLIKINTDLRKKYFYISLLSNYKENTNLNNYKTFSNWIYKNYEIKLTGTKIINDNLIISNFEFIDKAYKKLIEVTLLSLSKENIIDILKTNKKHYLAKKSMGNGYSKDYGKPFKEREIFKGLDDNIIDEYFKILGEKKVYEKYIKILANVFSLYHNKYYGPMKNRIDSYKVYRDRKSNYMNALKNTEDMTIADVEKIIRDVDNKIKSSQKSSKDIIEIDFSTYLIPDNFLDLKIGYFNYIKNYIEELVRNNKNNNNQEKLLGLADDPKNKKIIGDNIETYNNLPKHRVKIGGINNINTIIQIFFQEKEINNDEFKRLNKLYDKYNGQFVNNFYPDKIKNPGMTIEEYIQLIKDMMIKKGARIDFKSIKDPENNCNYFNKDECDEINKSIDKCVWQQDINDETYSTCISK